LRAYQRCGITPTPVAMRGGYDGAVLSQKGLPCPNIFTGAHNFHSIYEYLPVRSLRAASDVVIAIIQETFNGFTTGNRES
ncbi:peptidase T, partial [Escherichia coli]|nr:peptidase T [Escherichia coli]